ncbi:MAG: oligosaccharide flippase family protein [Chitinivibrionales bacterium]|nr:oligosaccharide flippase family protein [Chitinivibrionales bacterium]
MDKQHGIRLIKNSVLTLFNTFFMLGTTWVISIWVARQLGPESYGVFTLVLWFTGTISWAMGMGLIHAVTKFIAEYQGKGEGAQCTPIVIFVLKVELALTGVSTVVLLFFRSQIADYFFSPNESFFFLLAFLGLVPGVITAIFSATIEGLQKFEYFTLSNFVITPLSFVSKVIVLWLGKGINGLLVVMLVFSFANALFYAIVLHREGIVRAANIRSVPGELRKRLLKYNASVMAILACDKIVWDKSENFFLGRFCPASEIGFYNLGFNVAQRFTSILPQTFWRVLFPAMSGYFGSGSQDKMKRLFFISTRYLAFFAFPSGIAGMILSYQIIHYLYGHDFIGAQRVLQIICVSSIFSSLSNPASAVLYGFEKQAFIYKYGLVLAVINIALDVFLIRRYGAVGAAICYGITTVLGSIGGLIYTCRLMKLIYPFYSVFKIIFATIIMGLTMELVLLQNQEVPGFIISVISGAGVYLICSLVLGTFEKEDYIILDSVKKILPGRTKGVVDAATSFISQFKNGR